MNNLSLVENRVLLLKRHHNTTWRGRSDLYWLFSLIEEMGELALALLGLHDGPVEWELQQIAAIAMNWMEKKRREKNEV